MAAAQSHPGRSNVENFLHISAVWLHILGIALFVGPQFFLAFAAVPAARGITDLATRARAMRTMTKRFGYIGGAGLVLIIGAGTYLISTWRDYYAIDESVPFTDMRYGVIFIIKMSILLVMLALVAVHTFVIGPRQVALMEGQARGSANDAELLRVRKLSMMTSIVALLLTLIIMVMGASMSTTTYSFQDA